MKTEIRLRAVLRHHGLSCKHGVVQRIAEATGLHRHTVSKMWRGDGDVSVRALEKLCSWLEEHGVPPSVLPQTLLGSRPSELWRALSASGTEGTVHVYVGEYQETERSRPVMLWVSRRDMTVAGEVVRVLSTPSDTGGAHPKVLIDYVPFRYSPRHTADRPKMISRERLEGDIARAKRIYDTMEKEARNAVLVGSQQANFLVEMFTARLFGVKAFESPKRKARVPFYLAYRGSDKAIPSCFGGLGPPPGGKGSADPGIYYMGQRGEWIYCPWKSREQDAGVVMTLYERAVGRVVVVMFGFSGMGTEALGRRIVEDADPFWEPYLKIRDREIGVYVCTFKMKEDDLTDAGKVVRPRDFHVTPLEEKILRTFLKK